MLLPLLALVAALALGVWAVRPCAGTAWVEREREVRTRALRRTPERATWRDVADLLARDLGPGSVHQVVQIARAHGVPAQQLWTCLDRHGLGAETWALLDVDAPVRESLWHLRTRRDGRCVPVAERLRRRLWSQALRPASRSPR